MQLNLVLFSISFRQSCLGMVVIWEDLTDHPSNMFLEIETSNFFVDLVIFSFDRLALLKYYYIILNNLRKLNKKSIMQSSLNRDCFLFSLQKAYWSDVYKPRFVSRIRFQIIFCFLLMSKVMQSFLDLR
jgi:hypothetical protein